MTITKNGVLDRFGIWVSSLCAVHCLALPVLLPIAPLIGASFFAEAWFERTILSLSLLVGFWALFSGFYRYHRQLYPLYSLCVGGLIYWNKGMFGDSYEPFTIAAGAFLLISAHIVNLKLCNDCKACENH
ncbi:MerC domain-containing protein [Neptunicella sp. SCSIO 80796]|uniref:MerC domain-containing protein n=1 Tax=Neptunicella plasticusilytica TaxID=3117012 RepID=UPI003A4E3C91